MEDIDYTVYGITIEPDCNDRLVQRVLVQLFYATGLALFVFCVGLWFGVQQCVIALNEINTKNEVIWGMQHFVDVAGIYSSVVLAIWLLDGLKKHL